MSSGLSPNFLLLDGKRWDSRNRVLADVDGALAPDRQPFGMGLMKPCKLDHVVSMLFRVERADHVSPFSRPRDRDRATARAIRQALDGHGLNGFVAVFEQWGQDHHSARAAAPR